MLDSRRLRGQCAYGGEMTVNTGKESNPNPEGVVLL